MKILMIGSGGREHALILKLLESDRVEKIYCTPGNGGISRYAECLEISAIDIEGIIKSTKELNIDLVFVAPDDPLAIGMVDALEKQNIRAFGPSKRAAEIESSKAFSKDLMKKYNIPTAAYEVFFEYSSAKDYIESISEFPIVIKADGLALGKGVIICEDKNSALFTLEEMMLNKKFGSAGDKIVVEEFLTGPEVSVLAFTDGKTIFPMVSSKDHKRALDEDMGLNTGGMGTISPNPYYTKEIESMCMSEIFIPTINAMVKEGRKFKGCLYFGLMITTDGAKVIEYNARFGDPEAQVVLPRLKTPLIDIIDAVIDEKLDEISIDWHDEAAACIIISSGGYPENYEKGYEISGLNSFGQIDDITKVYHSGTVYKDNKFYTNGGRVLGITAMDKTLEKAIEKAYYGVHQVSFKDMHFRKDIGRIK